MISYVLGLDGNSMAKVFYELCSVNEGLIVRVLVTPLFGLSSMVGLLMNLGMSLMLQSIFTMRVSLYNITNYLHQWYRCASRRGQTISYIKYFYCFQIIYFHKVSFFYEVLSCSLLYY
ncbi:hypothetical protein HanPSC8_Chr01g0023811 [Helianthus annuus]|nr:hypothetical protein HanPSC8_Chr01g0023811 [Helianthus annuus]